MLAPLTRTALSSLARHAAHMPPQTSALSPITHRTSPWGTPPASTRGFGAGDLKIIAQRLKSVKSIQKITKAMKMVAASKMRSEERRLQIGIAFASGIRELIERLPVEGLEKSEGTTVMVAVSSDKGLCGGVNNSVTRTVRETIDRTGRVICLGDRARSALARVLGPQLAMTINEIQKHPLNWSVVSMIADRILAHNPNKIKIIHNHFKSRLSYEQRTHNLITKNEAIAAPKSSIDEFEFEPDFDRALPDLMEFYTAACIFGDLLDNVASEQSARVSAMDNASTNASDMISSLNLRYNRARQAKITTELVEIISGANAL